MGLISGASYSSAEYTLKPGDRILLTTDGLVEAEDVSGEAFGESRLSEIAHRDLNAILDHVFRFQSPNEAQDDCTLLEVRYLGANCGTVSGK